MNGDIYIGQTIYSLSYRWKKHCISQKSYFSSAIRKYGKENFSKEIIGTYSNLEDLNNAEEYFIQLNNSLVPNGYNLLPGGNNKKHHDKTKEKLSLIFRGNIIPNHWNGGNKKSAPHSNETKNKISVGNTGQKRSEESKRRMSFKQKGKIVTEKTKNKISTTMTGIPQPWKYKRVQVIETGFVYESIKSASIALGITEKLLSISIKMGYRNKKTGLTFKFFNSSPEANKESGR